MRINEKCMQNDMLPSGNRTLVPCMTGGYTYHYTNDVLFATALILMNIMSRFTFYLTSLSI